LGGDHLRTSSSPLEPVASGTRLTVVETSFAQLHDDEYSKAFSSNTNGWSHELGELADYFDKTA